jgi:DNA mismatch endonuclease (patch repair protein)
MSQVKGRNTKPEIILRRWLWSSGFRYRLHSKKLPGKPDIVFPGRKKVIFVHGCFWHKHDCGHFSLPKSNTEFWKKKILGNVKRDRNNIKAIVQTGWKPFVVWECELKKGVPPHLQKKIIRFLDGV